MPEPTRRIVVLTPVGEHPTEIEQRVAERREFPVDHGGHLRPVGRHHHVRELVVTVDDADVARRRQVGGQPVADPVDAVESGTGVVREFAVPVELAAPAAHLTTEPVVGLAEVAQTLRVRIDGSEGGCCLDHRGPEPQPEVVGRPARRQVTHGHEAVDQPHAVEVDTDDVEIVAHSEELGVRHL